MQIHALFFSIIGSVTFLTSCQTPLDNQPLSWPAVSLSHEQRLQLIEEQMRQIDLNLEHQSLMQERYIIVEDFERGHRALQRQEQLMEQKQALEQERQIILSRLKKAHKA